MVNSISFRANFVQASTVKKYNNVLKEFEPYEASLIEIDTFNPKDLTALCKVACDWGVNNFAKHITDMAMKMCADKKFTHNNAIYGLTLQQDEFEKINPDELLGLMQFSRIPKEPIHVKYIQVDEKYSNYKKINEFKHIGTAFLDSLKTIYNAPITLLSLLKTTPFYEKNGFELVDPEKVEYLWTPPRS